MGETMKQTEITLDVSGPLSSPDLYSLESQLNALLPEYLHASVVARQQRISPDMISAIAGVVSAAAALLQIYLMLKFSGPQRHGQEKAKERARVLYSEKRISSVEIIEIFNLGDEGASDRLFFVTFKESDRFFRLSCRQEQFRVIVEFEEE